MLERLHKILARAGVAALRPAEDMILAGRVTVNGRVVRELGARADSDGDVIAVDGQPIDMPTPSEPHRYYVLNKPVGVISTAYDPEGRPTVVELVPDDVRVFPVGRLDADSEGLLLLTDDGDLAYRLTHPRFEVEKEYRVLLDQPLSLEAVRRWRNGVELPTGDLTAPAWVERLEQTPDGDWLRVVLHEGKKREIREVARVLGYDVRRLIRVREGSITLVDLAVGAWRLLSPTELEALRRYTQRIPAPEPYVQEPFMADDQRPRRLRVVRGPRRPEGADAPPAESTWSATPTRARMYDRPMSPNDVVRPDEQQAVPAPTSTGERRTRFDDRPVDFGNERRPESFRRDDRPQGGFGGPRPDDNRGFGGPRRDDNRPHQGDSRGFGGPRQADNRGFGSPRPDADRGSGRPPQNNRGFGGPRRDDNRGFGSPRPDADRGSGRPPRDDSQGFGGPRRDDNRPPQDGNRGFGGQQRDANRSFGGPRRDDNRGFGGGRSDADRGSGRPPRADNRGFGGPRPDTDRGSGRPPRDDNRGFGGPRRDDSSSRGFGGPRRDDNRGFGGPRRDDNRGFGGPRPDADRGSGRPPRDDNRGFNGPRPDVDRGSGRPPRDDGNSRGFSGPRRDDDRGNRGPTGRSFGGPGGTGSRFGGPARGRPSSGRPGGGRPGGASSGGNRRPGPPSRGPSSGRKKR